MTKSIQQLIAEHKHTHAFGSMTAIEVENGRRLLLRSLGETEVVRPTYGYKAWMAFLSALVFDSFARPVAVGFASVVLALGASVFAVNASSSSVPGDTLYPVKIAAEKVQLSLTSSTSQRAKLHVDFAERRLNEVKEIRKSDRKGKQVRVQSALQSFRQEIASANSQLESLSKDNSASASSVANLIDQKSSEFQNVIRDSVAKDPGASGDVVRGAQEDAVNSGQAAARVLVEAQELLPEDKGKDNLQEVFQKDVEEIEARIAVIRHRLEIIDKALAIQTDSEVVATARPIISKIRMRLTEIRPSLDDAVNALAAGGYRRTFEIVAELQNTMTVTDDLLAQLEIVISTSEKVETESVPESLPTTN